MTDAAPDTEAKMIEFLSQWRGASRLPIAVVARIAATASTLLTEVEELEALDANTFVELAVGDIAEPAKRRVIASLAQFWFTSEPTPEGKVLNKATYEAQVDATDPVMTTPNMLPAATVGQTTYRTDEERKDCTSQDLNPTQAFLLSMHMFAGEVVQRAEVPEGDFGMDPATTEYARRRLKAKRPTLETKLASKDIRAVRAHFTRLISDLAGKGMVKEIKLVTEWWTSLLNIHQGNDDGLIAFIKEYMHRYRGRGIPCSFDPEIYALSSAQSQVSASLSDAQKKKIDAAGETAGKLTSLMNKIQSLEAQIQRQGESGEAASASRRNKTCDYCGRRGHFARDCRDNPESSKYQGAPPKDKAEDEKE